MTQVYSDPKQKNIGRRVQLHPSTDLWMRGDRYGEILRVQDGKYVVLLDKSERRVTIAPELLSEIFNGDAQSDALPPCALAMGCFCACHAAGLDASEPCDANEDRARELSSAREEE